MQTPPRPGTRQTSRWMPAVASFLIFAATAVGCGGDQPQEPDAESAPPSPESNEPDAAGEAPSSSPDTSGSPTTVEVAGASQAVPTNTASAQTVTPPDPLVGADATSAELVTRVALPGGVVPVAMAAGFGSVWVSDHNTPGVYRIDPATNSVSAHIQTNRGSCMDGVTVVLDEIWQSTCGAGTFVRIDPLTNQVIQEISGLTAVATRDGEIWATSTSPGALVKLDAASLTEVERVNVGADPSYLAVDDQSVWVVNHHDRTVSRVDRASGSVVATIPLGAPSLKGGGAITLAGGHVWVDHLDDGSVYRIDPLDNSADRIFLDIQRSGHYWEQYLHGSDVGVWVRVRRGVLAQLSSDTGQPITALPVDPGGGDMETAFGSLWVNGVDGVQRFTIG